MAMTNDEYHDILDAIEVAKADFRYVSVDDDGSKFEIEAYQISQRSRYQNQEWPPWLKMQKRPDDMNAVFCDSSSPDNLTLALPGGERLLSTNNWVVQFKNGDLSVITDGDFQNFSKVLPVPEAPFIPPADHPDMEDPRIKEVPILAAVPDIAPDVEELENAVCAALQKLASEDAEAAQLILAQAMSERVTWCDCAPGSCAEGPVLSCRRNSPLVK